MVKTLETFSISVIETIEVFDSLGRVIATFTFEEPRQKDNKNITNCRNCGAPLKSRICEYCGTRY